MFLICPVGWSLRTQEWGVKYEVNLRIRRYQVTRSPDRLAGFSVLCVRRWLNADAREHRDGVTLLLQRQVSAHKTQARAT